MEQYKFWEERGVTLGMSGTDLYNFIMSKTKEVKERDERARVREQQRIAEERAHEAKRIADEREEKRLADAREEKRIADAREYEIGKREHELEVIRLKASLGTGSEEEPKDLMSSMVKMPKMPPFNDGEDITAYFIRFEQMANVCKWPADSWAVRLGLLFQGNALKVYSSLPPDIMNDYEALKKAILKAYKKTPDQYRKDFRFAKISSKENYSQFLVSLYRLFDYWVNSTGIAKTYEALRDLCVGDQFFNITNH